MYSLSDKSAHRLGTSQQIRRTRQRESFYVIDRLWTINADVIREYTQADLDLLSATKVCWIDEYATTTLCLVRNVPDVS